MHQPEFPVLAIIICSWNTCEILDDCLQSIYRHPPNVTFEVWVVDNASKDSSVQMVKSKYPQVRLIENSQNVGFAGANNRQFSSRRVNLCSCSIRTRWFIQAPSITLL
jgi:GT2 family glycosyltransferase